MISFSKYLITNFELILIVGKNKKNISDKSSEKKSEEIVKGDDNLIKGSPLILVITCGAIRATDLIRFLNTSIIYANPFYGIFYVNSINMNISIYLSYSIFRELKKDNTSGVKIAKLFSKHLKVLIFINKYLYYIQLCIYELLFY